MSKSTRIDGQIDTNRHTLHTSTRIDTHQNTSTHIARQIDTHRHASTHIDTHRQANKHISTRIDTHRYTHTRTQLTHTSSKHAQVKRNKNKVTKNYVRVEYRRNEQNRQNRRHSRNGLWSLALLIAQKVLYTAWTFANNRRHNNEFCSSFLSGCNFSSNRLNSLLPNDVRSDLLANKANK